LGFLDLRHLDIFLGWQTQLSNTLMARKVFFEELRGLLKKVHDPPV
jgi:hypothetical protein